MNDDEDKNRPIYIPIEKETNCLVLKGYWQALDIAIKEKNRAEIVSIAQMIKYHGIKHGCRNEQFKKN
jgi:hypothetical protein